MSAAPACLRRLNWVQTLVLTKVIYHFEACEVLWNLLPREKFSLLMYYLTYNMLTSDIVLQQEVKSA